MRRSPLSGARLCPALAAIVAVSLTGAGYGGIQGTPHDLSTVSWSRGQVCLPCHASHGASDETYRWNHSYAPDEAFTKRPGALLGLDSLTCLGCHDGQTAMDSFGGDVGSQVLTGRTVVGRDLTSEHPVGVAYPDGDPRFVSAQTVEQSLRLYDGKVECASCHDPHDNSRGSFLRTGTRSLCQTCHDL